MKLMICALSLLGTSLAHAGLERYSHLVVADPGTRLAQPNEVRVTYLGVNGYRFETADHVLLVDPYFTRTALLSVATNDPIASIPGRVEEGFKHINTPADAILVTHAHFDHLLDVPDMMRRTHAQLISGPTAVNLVRSFGIPRKDCQVVRPGDVRSVGPWTIRVLKAVHDRVSGFSVPPYPGTVPAPAKPPVRPSDWKLGEPLAFIIEGSGKHIYIDSGGLPGYPPKIGDEKIDLAILGVALPDSRMRYPEALRRLKPRFILPSHQDDFFEPFARGFAFGKLSNFPEILRAHRKENLPGNLILLDYFQPWTIR